MKSLIISILLLCSSPLLAVEKLGVQFPEKISIANKELQLNGIGIRKATFFKVKVYVGGLYMEKKSSNPLKFLNSDDVKYIRMHFVRDVGAGKMRGGWEDAFKASVKNYNALKPRIDRFLSYQEDIKEKQEILITFLPDGVETTYNNKRRDKIKGKDFSQALLSVWFINASDTGLKEGLLGI